MPSSRPNRMGPAWVWRSAVRSSSRMAGVCGPRRMTGGVRHFVLPCQSRPSLTLTIAEIPSKATGNTDVGCVFGIRTDKRAQGRHHNDTGLLELGKAGCCDVHLILSRGQELHLVIAGVVGGCAAPDSSLGIGSRDLRIGYNRPGFIANRSDYRTGCA